MFFNDFLMVFFASPLFVNSFKHRFVYNKLGNCYIKAY